MAKKPPFNPNIAFEEVVDEKPAFNPGADFEIVDDAPQKKNENQNPTTSNPQLYFGSVSPTGAQKTSTSKSASGSGAGNLPTPKVNLGFTTEQAESTRPLIDNQIQTLKLANSKEFQDRQKYKSDLATTISETASKEENKDLYFDGKGNIKISGVSQLLEGISDRAKKEGVELTGYEKQKMLSDVTNTLKNRDVTMKAAIVADLETKSKLGASYSDYADLKDDKGNVIKKGLSSEIADDVIKAQQTSLLNFAEKTKGDISAQMKPEVDQLKNDISSASIQIQSSYENEFNQISEKAEIELQAKYEQAVQSGQMTQEQANEQLQAEYQKVQQDINGSLQQKYAPEFEKLNQAIKNNNQEFQIRYNRLYQKEIYQAEQNANTAIKNKLESTKVPKDIQEEYSKNFKKAYTSELAAKNEQFLNAFRNLPTSQKINTSFATGVGDVFSSVGGAMGYAGLEDGAYKLNQWSQSVSENNQLPNIEINDATFLSDPDWWITNGVRSIPFTLATMPLGMGGGTASSVMARLAGATAKSARIYGAVGGGTAGWMAERFLEQGNAFNDAINEGASEKEASERAAQVGQFNIATLPLNIAQMLPVFGKGFKFLNAAGIEAASGYLEEVIQGWAQEKSRRISKGQDITFGEYFFSLPALQEGTVGAAMGQAFTLASMSKTDNKDKQINSVLNSITTGGVNQAKAQLEILHNNKELSDAEFSEATNLVDYTVNAIDQVSNININDDMKVGLIGKYTEIERLKSMISENPDDLASQAAQELIAEKENEIKEIIKGNEPVYLVKSPGMEVPISVPKEQVDELIKTGASKEVEITVFNDDETQAKIDELQKEQTETTENTEIIAGETVTTDTGVPGETITTDTVVEDNKDDITVSDMIDKTGSYKGEKGTFFKEGQTVLFKPDKKNIEYELGNFDQISETPISDFDITHESSVVEMDDSGGIKIRGKSYVNNFTDPIQAINRDEEGNVVSVNLETPEGKKRTFRGNIAEDLAYQIYLKSINKDDVTREKFEQFINTEAPGGFETTEVPATTQTVADGNAKEIPREKIIPKKGQNTVIQEKGETTNEEENKGKEGLLIQPVTEPVGESATLPTVQLSDEQKESDNKEAKSMGWTSAPHAINSVNQRFGSKYKSWSEIPSDVKSEVSQLRGNSTENPLKEIDADVSGIKKELVPSEKLSTYEIERHTIKEMLESGKRMVDEGDINPKILVEEVVKSPRALQPEEVASLVYYKAQLDNNISRISDKIQSSHEKGDYDREALYRAEFNVLLKDLDGFHEMAIQTASKQSMAFMLRKALLDSEYNLQSQIIRYKSLNKGIIPEDVLQKFQDYDRQLKELNKKISELQEKEEIYEGQISVENIKESVEREYKSKNKSILTEAEVQRKKELSRKYRNRFNDITSFAALIAEKEFYEYSGLVFKETAGEFKQFAKQIIKTVGKGVKEHLPELYKKLGGKQDAEFEQESPSIRNGKLYIPESLIRDIVASGKDNINDLTNELLDQIKEEIPQATDRLVRDAITKYGKTVNLSQKELDVKIRDIKRTGRLISALEDVNKKKTPLKSGMQRDKLSDEQRRLQRDVKEGMKDIPVSEEDAKKVWTSALESVKNRLKNQISDLEKQIETGEKSEKKKGLLYDNEAKELQAKRDELKKVINELEGPSKISDEQRLRNAISSTQRSIDKYDRRIKEQDFSSKKKTDPIHSKELSGLKSLRYELKETYQELEKESGVAEQKRLDLYKKGLTRSIKKYEQRIAKKDFTPKAKNKMIGDYQSKGLEMEKLRIKEKFDIEMEKARRENRPNSEKIKDAVVDVLNLPKSLMASADFSALLRQGAILSAANPKAASKATIEMFRQAFSEKRAQDFLFDLKSSDKYPLMRQSKLYLSEPSAKLSAKEEDFISNIAERIPVWGRVVKGSSRAYNGYLNKLRIDVFNSVSDAMIANGYNPDTNIKPFKDLATFINNATGRGNLGSLEKSADVLNTGFFSPRFLVSRLNLLNPVAYVKMDKTLRKESLRSVFIYWGAIVAINALFGAGAEDSDDYDPVIETDPQSSDFGKIKIRNIRFDIAGGFGQLIVLMARLVSGETKDSRSGKISDRNRLETLGRFFRTKTSPISSTAIDALDGKDMINRPFRRPSELLKEMGYDLPYSDEIIDLVIPMYTSDLKEIYEKEGLGTAAASAIPSMFGAGVQYYE